VIRETFDQIYDGQHTGRWDADQLNKTEKTHIGTLIQINLQKALDILDGVHLDYRIAGIEIDCKWSRSIYAWEIPKEMYIRGPQLALLVWASDYTSRWAVGLIRITESVLRPMGRQGDQKRRLNNDSRDRILWIGQGDLVRNALLHMDPDIRQRILNQRSGQQAVISMFREFPGLLVNRATILTLAQQDDCMKRVRDARIALKSEGVVIFGHYKPQPEMAAALGLPRPTLGRFVSARLAGCEEEHHGHGRCVEIQGQRWRLARTDDEMTDAPMLPKQGRESE
jgi:hypothetical protein